MSDEEKKALEAESSESLDEANTEAEEVIDDEQLEESGESEETVPLSTFLELKNKYKKIKKQHGELVDKSLEGELVTFKDKKILEYTQLGYTEEQAERFVSDLLELKKQVHNTQVSRFEQDIIEDIDELKKDTVFKGIEDYTEAIIEKIKETKKKGYKLDVEDAYILVSKENRKVKLKDAEINNTQAEIIRNKKLPAKNNSNVSNSQSGGKPVNYGLDEHDRKALTELQKMQPDANWTPKKYYEMIKKE
jgi:hypothetical protein